jgi:hypothetical protein
MICQMEDRSDCDHCHHAHEHAYMSGPSTSNGCAASLVYGDCPGCSPTTLKEFAKFGVPDEEEM